MHTMQHGVWQTRLSPQLVTGNLPQKTFCRKTPQVRLNEEEPKEWRRYLNIVSPIVLAVCLAVVYRLLYGTTPIQIKSVMKNYTTAAVAADSTICSEIGREILENKGGSAVDAAVATMFCMGVVNFHSMGIGGGHFATIYDSATEKVYVLDALEMAPGLSEENMFAGNPEAVRIGPLSVAVPGEVKGYWAMHQRFGWLPWSDLLQPTIDLCEHGYPVVPSLDRALRTVVKKNRASEDLRPLIYRDDTDELFATNDTIRCYKLAQTLRILAKEGGDSFYNGTLAKLIAKDIQEKGGIITEDDLMNYEVKWRTPMSVTLKDGLTVYSPPSPGSGQLLSLMLNILDGYDFNADSLSTLSTTLTTYHRMIEAFKFAFAYRSELGDPDFVDISEKYSLEQYLTVETLFGQNCSQVLLGSEHQSMAFDFVFVFSKLESKMSSKDLAERLRQMISDERTYDTDYYGNTSYNEVKEGTGQLSLIDAWGNAVSITSSINQYCGSTVVGRRTGIFFNNAMDDFSSPNITNLFGIEPSPANYIAARKRPLSSMSPVLILGADNSVKMVTGAAGGSKIPSTLTLVILRVLKLGQNLTEATDAARFHHQLLPTELQVDRTKLPNDILNGLNEKGHVVKLTSIRSTVVQSILVQKPYILAVSDDRKGGEADGY